MRPEIETLKLKKALRQVHTLLFTHGLYLQNCEVKSIGYFYITVSKINWLLLCDSSPVVILLTANLKAAK